MIRIKQPTKRGYIEVVDGGVVDLTYPSSTTRRGRVQEHGTVSPAVCANGELCLIWQEKELSYENKFGVKKGGDEMNSTKKYRIRKLTPLECWR